MKHKLTVLACIGLALLLTSGTAFAQNTVTVVGGTLARCAAGQAVRVELSNADAIGAIGLPLTISGGTITGASAEPALAGFTTAVGGFPGAAGVLNAVGGNLAPGSYLIWSLEVATDASCGGQVVIDTAFFPPAGAFLLGDAGCCAAPSPEFNAGVFTIINEVPACGINSDETVNFAGSVNKQLNASDADACDVLTYALVSIAPPVAGAAAVSPTGVFTYSGACADLGAHTVTFSATDDCGAAVQCNFTLTVTNDAPICGANSDENVYVGDGVVNKQLNASDPNSNPLTYSLVSVVPPAVGVASVSASGVFNYATVCGDVGAHTVTFSVSDGCASVNCAFQVVVTNAPATVACPADQAVVAGNDVSVQIGGADPEGGLVSFSLVSFTALDGQGAPADAPSVSGSGLFEWTSGDPDVGTWQVCVRAEDACGAGSECCFLIEVEPATIDLCIRDTSGSPYIPILNGQIATAYITLNNSFDLGGIDLLVCYDQSGLSFLDAFPVDELTDWEYFTWRHSPNSNCAGSCPSGYLRIVAIADLDNGPSNHPAPASFKLDGQIVGLRFIVTSDRNFIGQCLNVGFCVLDCGDNALSSKSGDTLFIPIGSPDDCIDTSKQAAVPYIVFCPGAICIQEPPDDRGDINLNGIANEIGDAVLFTNYFIYGSSVWDPTWMQVQILATDINDDGIVLTVADLIYLIRIITGDAQPFPPGTGTGHPKLSPYANSATATVRVENNSVSVSTSSNVDLGGALLVFRYNGLSTGEPALLSGAEGMNLRYNASGNELRVLVHPSWNDGISSISAGNREILSIPTTGEGSIELVEVQMSDAHGALMSTTSAKAVVPTEYALQQNYPNPFNAGTVMTFDLINDADWTLTVYNVAGQTVREFAGRNGVGSVRVAWDGNTSDGMAASSGVYFYRVTANGFTATKKMTLVK